MISIYRHNGSKKFYIEVLIKKKGVICLKSLIVK